MTIAQNCFIYMWIEFYRGNNMHLLLGIFFIILYIFYEDFERFKDDIQNKRK